MGDFYETAVQRGVYSAADFFKAKQYGIPYAPGVEVSKITASFVLLLRVPGSLEKVGVHFRVTDPPKNSYLYQKDLEGEEYKLPSNLALLDVERNLEAALETWDVEPSQIP